MKLRQTDKSCEQTDGPFHVVTDTRGVMTYLPPHYAEYIKNDNRFSFAEFAHRVSEGAQWNYCET